jgi:hypothetical protein
MATVSTAFGEFDDNLNLDRDQRERAQERHVEIRELLEATGVVSTSFLQGSFARKTMLKPLKDVDIVIVLDAEAWPDLRGPGGPAAAMAFFRREVGRRWPTATFDQGEAPSAKALRVSFADTDFTVDLVPAIDADGDYVDIGDREERRWIRSNTRIQISRIRDRNVATKSRFVHQVRMLKTVVRQHEDLEFFKGIVVESLAYRIIGNKMRDPEAVALALRESARQVTDAVIEPGGDDDVTIKWIEQERALAARRLSDAATQAEEALRLEKDGDHDAAIDVWHAVFGPDFPTAPPLTESATLHRIASGGLTSTGRATASFAAAATMQPVRAWRSH